MKTKILVIFIVSLFSNLHFAFAQGSLTPSAPPGPMMVTLSQIEPRTPISSVPYTISLAGSYYLTTNLAVSSGNAITISANGVTLDLSGFTISSTAASAAGTAILLNGTVTNIAIYNGHISSGVTNNSAGSYGGSGFANGIFGSGTPVNNPVNVRIKDVSVAGVLDYGIIIGTASTVVEGCAVNVAGLDGISASTVSDSTALNAGSDAIIAQTAENCYGTTSVNGSESISGILVENCSGTTTGDGTGVGAILAENCYGTSSSVGGLGISADTAESCYGQGFDGIDVQYNAENCYGYGISGYGIDAQTAVNCEGVSDGSGAGVAASYTAQNCSGLSDTGIGLSAASIATSCYGASTEGTGLVAFLANGCVGHTSSGTATNLTHNINSFAY